MKLMTISNDAQRLWQITLGLVGLAIVIAVVAYTNNQATSNVVNNVVCEESLTVNDVTYDCVERVDKPDERTQGLSGTNDLLPREGMLFEFEDSGQYGFWMKDMNYPIDILWLTDEGMIVNIQQNVSPDTYPESFVNNTPALYVLEVAAGQVEASGAELGDVITGVIR